MAIADLIPQMDDAGLANLHANAQRLAVDAVEPQRGQAALLLPLIEVELAEREARKPAPAAPKRRTKKVVVEVEETEETEEA
jgi:hypothetical protein